MGEEAREGGREKEGREGGREGGKERKERDMKDRINCTGLLSDLAWLYSLDLDTTSLPCHTCRK